MAKLATFAVAAIAGAVIGIVGVVATIGALSPSADHIAETSTIDPAAEVYGTR